MSQKHTPLHTPQTTHSVTPGHATASTLEPTHWPRPWLDGYVKSCQPPTGVVQCWSATAFIWSRDLRTHTRTANRYPFRVKLHIESDCGGHNMWPSASATLRPARHPLPLPPTSPLAATSIAEPAGSLSASVCGHRIGPSIGFCGFLIKLFAQSILLDVGTLRRSVVGGRRVLVLCGADRLLNGLSSPSHK